MLYGDVIIIKISWQTCLDWQSHCCSSWHYSSFNLHCGSEMFCSLVHLILILVEMLLMPQLKTLLPALLNLYVSRTVTSMTTLHLFSHWHAVFCHSEKCLSHVSRVTCHHSTSTWIGPNEQPWLLHLFPLHFAILTHVSQGGALKEINENWFITGFTSVAQKFCEAFLTTQVKPVKWKH